MFAALYSFAAEKPLRGLGGLEMLCYQIALQDS